MTSEGATSITATNRLPDPLGVTITIPFGNYTENDVLPEDRVAQTFTAEIGGRLLSVSMSVASFSPDPGGLQLAITTLENGQPGTILATAPFQGLDVNGGFTDIEVLNASANFASDQVMLENQQQYALLFVAEQFPRQLSGPRWSDDQYRGVPTLAATSLVAAVASFLKFFRLSSTSCLK